MIDYADKEYVKRLRQKAAGVKAAETRRRNAETARLGTVAPKPSLVKPSPIYVPKPEPELTIPPVPDLWRTLYRLRADGLLVLNACRQFAAEWGNELKVVEDRSGYFDSARFRFEGLNVYYRAFTAEDSAGDRNRFYHFERLYDDGARVY